jgi:hypothetical protein
VLKTVAEIRGLERVKKRLRQLEAEVRELRRLAGLDESDEGEAP